MADISSELNSIKHAIYGGEVRDSIHDAIEKINDDVDGFVRGELDTALTSTLLPAQGKAAGDAVADLKGVLNSSRDGYNRLLETEFNFVKNSFDGLYQNHFIRASEGTVDTASVNKQYVSSVNFIAVTTSSIYVQNLPNKNSSTSMWFYFYNSSKTYLSYSYIGNSGLTDLITVNVPAGTAYVKFMIDYGSGNTVDVKDIVKEIIITGSIVINNIINYKGNISTGNLNNVRTSGSYNIVTSDVSNITNLPVADGGTLFVIQGFGGGSHHCVQIYYTAGYKAYFRYVLDTGEAFGSWHQINTDINDSNYIKRIVVDSSTASSTFNSLASSFPINTEIACNKSWFNDMSEFPTGWYLVKTVPTSQNAGSLSQRLQVAISGLSSSGLSSPDEMVVAIRYIVSSEVQSDWIYLCRSFNNAEYIAFGDSICRGNHPDASKSQYAWPESFARSQKMLCKNKAIGGQGYLTTAYAVKAIETIQATDITNANLITLAYGINDASDTVTIGTINDTNENTVLGELYRCVSYIYSQNKHVQLIICGSTKQSGYWSTRLAEINEKLKDFATKYGIAFVDMSESPINQFNGSTSDGLTSDGTHFNDTGYRLLAQYMMAKLSSYFRN